MTGRRWLLLLGIALLICAGGRLVWPVQISFLGITGSCGNALAYLGGADNHVDVLDMSLCTGPLHSAVVVSSIMGFIGVVSLLLGCKPPRKRPMSVLGLLPNPGWYPAPWDPAATAWWDGAQWSPPTPPPEAPSHVG
jgi:hypothetical protein